MIINKHPDHYVMTALGFGDKPSGTIATLALRKTAEKYSHLYPKAAEVTSLVHHSLSGAEISMII